MPIHVSIALKERILTALVPMILDFVIHVHWVSFLLLELKPAVTAVQENFRGHKEPNNAQIVKLASFLPQQGHMSAQIVELASFLLFWAQTVRTPA